MRPKFRKTYVKKVASVIVACRYMLRLKYMEKINSRK